MIFLSADNSMLPSSYRYQIGPFNDRLLEGPNYKGPVDVRPENRRRMYCISETSQHDDDHRPLISSHMSSNDMVSFWMLAPLLSLSEGTKFWLTVRYPFY